MREVIDNPSQQLLIEPITNKIGVDEYLRSLDLPPQQEDCIVQMLRTRAEWPWESGFVREELRQIESEVDSVVKDVELSEEEQQSVQHRYQFIVKNWEKNELSERVSKFDAFLRTIAQTEQMSVAKAAGKLRAILDAGSRLPDEERVFFGITRNESTATDFGVAVRYGDGFMYASPEVRINVRRFDEADIEELAVDMVRTVMMVENFAEYWSETPEDAVLAALTYQEKWCEKMGFEVPWENRFDETRRVLGEERFCTGGSFDDWQLEIGEWMKEALIMGENVEIQEMLRDLHGDADVFLLMREFRAAEVYGSIHRDRSTSEGWMRTVAVGSMVDIAVRTGLGALDKPGKTKLVNWMGRLKSRTVNRPL